MDTIKINKQITRIIAHRGLSGIERENTCAAFIAAANRSYYGIETDVHVTSDGKYILIHDDDTNRVAGVDLPVEQSTFEELRGLTLPDKEGFKRGDLVLPTPEEYFSICKRYGKVAVFELKNRFLKEQIGELVQRIKELEMLENTVFISFFHANLVDLKEICPEAHAQYLSYREIDEKLIAACKDYDLGLDVRHDRLNEQTVAMLKQAGVEINCWTVDDPARAEELISLGVDYITTNILE